MASASTMSPLTCRYDEGVLTRHARACVNAQHVGQRQRHVRRARVRAVVAHPQLSNLHMRAGPLTTTHMSRPTQGTHAARVTLHVIMAALTRGTTDLETSQRLNCAVLLQRAQHLQLDAANVDDGLDARPAPARACAAWLDSLPADAALHQLFRSPALVKCLRSAQAHSINLGYSSPRTAADVWARHVSWLYASGTFNTNCGMCVSSCCKRGVR